ncbi:ABC transporter ATP-binding protein [Rubellicoccus peritrichatus]|uniref:ABC transporter ATP-binding protein n=1 Tax=Rubellicoccus peritrichatus TaxID=3080537 RepID=A0AAQ3QT60_9BACT|nr:ABC transporter ATP-binding protein [Puniceicoccus sp. CR14]WOO43343.1 ABC transporter ATP-binding protein [Puniceicoccus sp. CR14]
MNHQSEVVESPDLRHFIWDKKQQLWKGVAYAVMRNVALLPFPFFFQVIIDEYVKTGNVAGIGSIAMMFIGLLLIHYYFTIEGTKILASEVSTVISELRSRVFQKLQFLHFGYLDKQRAGRLLSKYAFDTQKVEMSLMPLLNQMVPNISHSILLAFLLAFLDWRLTLTVLLILPFYAVSRYLFFFRIQRKNRAARVAQEHLTGRANEFISAIRLIRGYGQEQRATGSLEESSETYTRSRIEQMVMNSHFGTFSTVSTNMLSLAVVAGGALLVVGGNLSLGTLFAFLAALPVIVSPIQAFTQISQQYFQGKEAFVSIRELLDSRYVEHWAGQRKIPDLKGDVEFEKVVFAYEGQTEPALNEISLKIPAGQHVALVGPSGSGKSTVANLILGLYNPSAGHIRVDGQSQEIIDMRWLRRRCAIVMQESLLLSGSIWDNLCFARPGATEEEIVEAARLANAESFIMDLPKGFETIVGERGVSLSGGQRQRISIARALLRDPRILILDEATSALDYESERLIQDALDNLARGRTVITIAHRLSTVKKADRIVVLEKGKIVEQGSFDELSDSDGYFSALLAAQG